MLADAPRTKPIKKEGEPSEEDEDNSVSYRELKTKEDIKNYVKGMI